MFLAVEHKLHKCWSGIFVHIVCTQTASLQSVQLLYSVEVVLQTIILLDLYQEVVI